MLERFKCHLLDIGGVFSMLFEATWGAFALSTSTFSTLLWNGAWCTSVCLDFFIFFIWRNKAWFHPDYFSSVLSVWCIWQSGQLVYTVKTFLSFSLAISWQLCHFTCCLPHIKHYSRLDIQCGICHIKHIKRMVHLVGTVCLFENNWIWEFTQ